MSLRTWTYMHEGIWSHGLGGRKVKAAQHIDSCAPMQHARTSHVQATLIVQLMCVTIRSLLHASPI
jgi:hypothetical protein